MTQSFPSPASPPTGRLRLASFALSVLTATVGLVASSPPASAGAPDPFFPTIARGNRGEDVRAAQLFLRQRGFEVAASGFFDADMVDVVKRFQERRGLAADGVVGPQTWRNLVMRAERGDRGRHVLALQRLLHKKHGYDVAVDRTYGNKTEVAVMDFKEHMGLRSDGVVGTPAWRYLLWHYVSVRDNRRTCVIDDDAAWGATTTVAPLLRAAKRFVEAGNDGIGVGHLS